MAQRRERIRAFQVVEPSHHRRHPEHIPHQNTVRNMACLCLITMVMRSSNQAEAVAPLPWHLHNTGQIVNGSAGVVGADIDAVGAWEIHEGTLPVLVAVLSSGVNEHRELGGRLLEGLGPPTDPFDWRDTSGLGTAIAGVIGASGMFEDGVTGVHPRVRILPLRVGTTPEQAAHAINWAAERGARVIVAATTFSNASEALGLAIESARANDVVVIAPSGNTGDNSVFYPAGFEACVAVGATDHQDQIAAFSTIGSHVDLVAPGVDVLAPHAGAVDAYTMQSHTAIAAGLVGGAAALLRSYSPQLSAEEIVSLLESNADDLGEPGRDDVFGHGRLNLRRALEAAPPPGLRIEPPIAWPTRIAPLRNRVIDFRIAEEFGLVAPGSALLSWRVHSASFTNAPLTSQGGGNYRATLPALACGVGIEYFVRTTDQGGALYTDPIGAPTFAHEARAGSDRVLLTDDFEQDRGWSASVEGDGSVSSAWQRVAPNANTTQPGFDRTPGGQRLCMITGQHLGGNPTGSNNDVDGGPIRLTSPVIEIPPNVADVEFAFSAWLQSINGVSDWMVVEVTTDGGANWTPVTVVESGDGWRDMVVPLASVLPPLPSTSTIPLRLRFSVSDSPSDSLTDAGVDDVRVTALSCVESFGDLNGDGEFTWHDLASLTSCLLGPNAAIDAECQSADTDGDGDVDLRDFGALQRAGMSSPN